MMGKKPNFSGAWVSSPRLTPEQKGTTILSHDE
jgi:hypothetical protein